MCMYTVAHTHAHTKILTFSELAGGIDSIDIGVFAVQLLGEGMAEQYLGRKLDLQDHSRIELRNRTSSARASFHAHKSELCGKSYHIRDKTELFDSVGTSTALLVICMRAMGGEPVVLEGAAACPPAAPCWRGLQCDSCHRRSLGRRPEGLSCVSRAAAHTREPSSTSSARRPRDPRCQESRWRPLQHGAAGGQAAAPSRTAGSPPIVRMQIPTAQNGCAAWSMTKAMCDELDATRRKML
jgi:hypothetical protein